MIPEIGSPTEFKRAVIDMHMPCVGEVYCYTTSRITEFWRVVNVNAYSTMSFVHYDTYVSFFRGTCYDKRGKDSKDILEWQSAMAVGKLRYYGHELPPVVDMND